MCFVLRSGAAIMIAAMSITACTGAGGHFPSPHAPDTTTTSPAPQQPLSSVTITTPQSLAAGSEASFKLAVTVTADAQLSVDFGDGEQQNLGQLTSGSKVFVVTHTYFHAGEYLLKAVVASDGRSSNTVSIVIVM
jgi:hypothetical protein